MPEAPLAPAAPTSLPAKMVPAAPALDNSGPTNGSNLWESIDKVVSEQKKAPEKATEKPQQKQEAPKKDTPQQKTEKKAEETPKSADGWEVEAVSLDEPKQEPSQKQEEAVPDMKPEAQTRWKELRKKEEELGTLKPEFERIKAEYEKIKDTPTKLDPAIEAELTELKRFKAAYDVENTPEYQTSVMEPYQAHMGKIQEVADYAKVPMDKIAEAMKEKNTLARTRALRDLFTNNTDGVELSSEEITIVTRAADSLHSEVFPKDKALRDQALEIQNGIKGQQEVQTSKQKEAQEKAIQAAGNELYGIMEAKLKPMGIFGDQDFVKALKEARPADPVTEPMSAAKQAQAALFLPKIVGKYNELALKVKELQTALKARGEAGAGVNDRNAGGLTERPKVQDEPDEGKGLWNSLSTLR